MAKVLLSLANGAVVVNEDAGVISVAINESLGGGKSAGMIKGSASIILDAEDGLKLGEQLVISHLPAAVQPLGQVVAGVINQAIDAIE